MRCECDENPWRIDKPLGDNNTGFQNFCEKVFKVPARVCNTHVSAIPANNGTFKKRFRSQNVYKQFYELVLRLKDCSDEDAGVKLQDRLCRWLAEQGEEEVADWFALAVLAQPSCTILLCSLSFSLLDFISVNLAYSHADRISTLNINI